MLPLIASPLNYTGGKFKLLKQMLPLFPKNIDTFVDLFCGGCNVGLNTKSTKTIYNDTNKELCNLYTFFKSHNPQEILDQIHDIILRYNLSLSSKFGYDFYGSNSNSGLATYNKNAFLKLRDDFNSLKQNRTDYIMFYVLIAYAFNNQIRFNAKNQFNLPVGKRDFNMQMQEKLISFMKRLQEQDCKFYCKDFREFNIWALKDGDFVYADPPYLITTATYNESNGWSYNDEKNLLELLDKLNANNIRFALSNVLTHKGKTNTILIEWLKNRNYKTHHLEHDYSNSNYQTKNKHLKSDEVLILNY